MANNSGPTNFGMQPLAAGAASNDERPEGTSMTDRKQTKEQPRSQQELQMGEKAPMPGEQPEGATKQQPNESTPKKKA